MKKENQNIRKAIKGDEEAIFRLIYELAKYEKAPEAVVNTPKQLAIDLFQDKICHCLVYEKEKEIIAIALYYVSYSTWKGRCLYLEDIIVQEEYRRTGIGKRLFNCLIDEAKEMGAGRMDWQVLEWNKSAIQFYKSIGASIDPESMFKKVCHLKD